MAEPTKPRDDKDGSIQERIRAAIKRITDGHAAMRVPAEHTDPDVVLAACSHHIDRLEQQLADMTVTATRQYFEGHMRGQEAARSSCPPLDLNGLADDLEYALKCAEEHGLHNGELKRAAKTVRQAANAPRQSAPAISYVMLPDPDPQWHPFYRQGWNAARRALSRLGKSALPESTPAPKEPPHG